jgi:hypothetical protein
MLQYLPMSARLLLAALTLLAAVLVLNVLYAVVTAVAFNNTLVR